MSSGLKQKTRFILKNVKSSLIRVPIKFWAIPLAFVIIISYVLCFIVPKNIDRNFASANWQTDIDTSGGIVAGGGGATPMSECCKSCEREGTRDLKKPLCPPLPLHACSRSFGSPFEVLLFCFRLIFRIRKVTTPMSEPETRALASITTGLLPRLEVPFHASGRLVGANGFGDSIAIGNLYASCVGYTSMIGHAEETMGYSITGEYEQWAGEQYGTPAILIELPTSSGYYFSAHLNTLWKMVNI